jgi:hypothetical protein
LKNSTLKSSRWNLNLSTCISCTVVVLLEDKQNEKKKRKKKIPSILLLLLWNHSYSLLITSIIINKIKIYTYNLYRQFEFDFYQVGESNHNVDHLVSSW